MQRTFLAAATGLLLAACAGPGAAPPPVAYDCEGGTVLRVRFEPGLAFVAAGDDRELRLPQQRAASGFWYGDGRHELRGKGQEATWTIGRRAPMACKARG